MSSNLSIKQLETFRAVMRSGSVSVAARSLCRSQPAISSMISNLENKLGFDLFERNKGRLTPKPEAYFLLEETEAVLERLTRSTQLMSEVKNISRGNLRIACMPAAALFFMPHMIADFVKNKPNVNISMMMRSSSIVHDWVASQQYDIGYCEHPKERSSLNVEPIELEAVCAVHQDHPLAKLPLITPLDLDGIPLACIYAQHPISTQLENAFDAIEAKYNVRFELQNYISAFEFVEQQLCCCICDPISAASYNFYKSGQGKVIFKPFSPKMKFMHAIITPAHKPLSMLAKAFAENIQTGVQLFIEKQIK